MKGRLGTLTALYVTQYLGIGFITVGLTAILRDGGTSLDTLALLQFVGLVWPLKFLWAPLLDRYGSRRHGHYRSWLLALQAGLVLTLLALLPFADPTRQLGPVVAICAAYVFLSATQDIAVDAVAVRVLSEGTRGAGNGIQVAASYLGNLLGGGACVLVYDRFGWVPAIGLLAAMTAVGLLVVWRLREPARIARVAGAGQAYRALLSVFGQPGCRWWTFGVVPLVYVGAGAAYALVTPALVDAGWSLARIGVVTGVVISAPAIVAGLLAGVGVDRFGRGRLLVVGGAALAVSTALLLPLMNGRAPLGDDGRRAVLLHGGVHRRQRGALRGQHGLFPAEHRGDRLHRAVVVRVDLFVPGGLARTGRGRPGRLSRRRGRLGAAGRPRCPGGTGSPAPVPGRAEPTDRAGGSAGRGARLTRRLPPLAVRPIRPPMCQVSALTRG